MQKSNIPSGSIANVSPQSGQKDKTIKKKNLQQELLKHKNDQISNKCNGCLDGTEELLHSCFI